MKRLLATIVTMGVVGAILSGVAIWISDTVNLPWWGAPVLVLAFCGTMAHLCNQADQKKRDEKEAELAAKNLALRIAKKKLARQRREYS